MKLKREIGTPKCALCPDAAVAEVILIGLGPDRAAYGCQRHIDLTVDDAVEGRYLPASMSVHDLDTGITTTVQVAPGPDDIDEMDPLPTHLPPFRTREQGPALGGFIAPGWEGVTR
jgi:hypothetical protein